MADFGDACDDNNSNTTGETVQTDCSCGGGAVSYDCPNLTANIGDDCDDNDSNTINDHVQEDCSCAGTIVNNNGLTIICPSNITITSMTNNSTELVNWDVPLAFTTCLNGLCAGNNIPGFNYLGQLNGSHYYLSVSKEKWVDANSNCETLGGHLAIINDANENQFIAGLIAFDDAVLLGISDAADEGNFTWVDGTSLVYSNWENGEPNNGGSSGEDYVVLHGWSNGKWADYGYWVQKHYIMEVDCDINITQTAGLTSGSGFPTGSTVVTYAASDACNNNAACSFEVTVLPGADPCDVVQNLALNQPSAQSSTKSGADASRANDGDTSGNYYVDFSVSHTNWEFYPWWEVDLGAINNISEIKIWNRDDCCMQHLSNFYVFVSEAPYTTNNLDEILADPDIVSYYQTDQVGLPTTLNIGRLGRYVRIQMNKQSFLALAEVEVIGCPDVTLLTGSGSSNLIQLTAGLNSNATVDLQWANIFQQNNERFVVERSLDGNIFEELFIINAAGESGQANVYAGLDPTPQEGYNFYRVHLINNDGTEQYSNLAPVSFQLDYNFTIFPNPANDRITLWIKGFIGDNVEIVIYDFLGRAVIQRHLSEVIDNLYTIEFGKEQLADGIYSVSIVRHNNAYSRKMVVNNID
jgi:hypothetical protein